MKVIKHWLALLCVGIILFTSCEKTVTSSQLGAIPADAMFVVSVEGEKLTKKGGLDNLKDYKFFQKISEEINQLEPSVQKFVNELIADPKSSGLDTKQSYIYAVNRNNGFYGSGVFKVDNLSVFDKHVAELVKLERNISIEDKGDYKLISPDRTVAFVWNESLLFILGGELNDVNYKELFTLPEDKSILSQSDFQTFIKQSHDVGFWCSYKQLVDMLGNVSGEQLPAIFDDFSNTFVHSYVNFENGEIKFTGKMSPQSKVDEFNKKYPVIKKDFNDKLLGDFPETSYFSLKLSVNWSEYLKLITETMPSTGDYQVDQIKFMLSNPAVQTVLDALGGDLLFSVYSFAQGPLPIPLMGLGFTVKSEDDFNNLLAFFPSGIFQKTGDYYTAGFGMGIAVYFAYKDNRVFVTDDVDAIVAFAGKGFDKTLKSNDLASSYKKDPFVFYFNLDLDAYPASIKTLLQTTAPRDIRDYLSLLDPYKDFTYTTSKNGEFVFSLKFKDRSQNSLKVLLKNLDDTASKY